jgi:hypothetical protein
LIVGFSVHDGSGQIEYWAPATTASIEEDVEIIIIHLRGLAPEGWIASPDNRA